jgi:hypothetical protein
VAVVSEGQNPAGAKGAHGTRGDPTEALDYLRIHHLSPSLTVPL